MIARDLLLQAQEPLHTFHLWEGISNQTVAVYQKYLLGREKLRTSTLLAIAINYNSIISHL